MEDVYKYGNRSMNFVNVWDPDVASDGFAGFSQRRYPVRPFFLPYSQCHPFRDTTFGFSLVCSMLQNGTFASSDPVACSPLDTVGHSCARGSDNDVGFYECQRASTLNL